jgi:hypothetical protein
MDGWMDGWTGTGPVVRRWKGSSARMFTRPNETAPVARIDGTGQETLNADNLLLRRVG